MSLPRIATRDAWLAARKELLAKEKDLTRQRDALNAERRDLPMVEIDKDYIFDGPNGAVRLIDLFEGRRQLIIYHFMFDPEWEDGCPSCTAGTDELSPGFLEHLHTRDTSYAMVSRAPLPSSSGGRPSGVGTSPGTPRSAPTSTTTSASRSTSRSRPASTTSAPRPSSRPWGRTSSPRPALRDARPELLPPRRRPGVPHLLPVRPRPGVDRRLVLLPRPHRARPAGGVGGAQGTQRVRTVRHARLRVLTAHPVPVPPMYVTHTWRPGPQILDLSRSPAMGKVRVSATGSEPMEPLAEYVDGLPNLCGQEPLISEAITAGRKYPVFPHDADIRARRQHIRGRAAHAPAAHPGRRRPALRAGHQQPGVDDGPSGHRRQPQRPGIRVVLQAHGRVHPAAARRGPPAPGDARLLGHAAARDAADGPG